MAVVRALINQPQLLLADEPTGALDHASATSLGQLLVELNKEEGVTLIVVTHAMDLAKRMGRVATLSDGGLWKPNDEARMSNDEGSPNDKCRTTYPVAIRTWCFVILSSFVI